MSINKLQEKYANALSHFNTNEFLQAEEILTEILTEYDDFNTLYLLAIIKSKGQKFQEAIKLYDQLIEVDSKHSEAHYNKALCHQHLGQNDKAISAYEKALSFNPTLIDAYNNIAVIYKNEGNYELAEKYYFKAIQKNDNVTGSNAVSGIGSISTQEISMLELRKALELMNSSKLNEALEVLNSIHSKYEDNPDIIISLANVHFHLENYEDSIKYFSLLIDSPRDSAIANYSIGVCKQRLDKMDEASAFYHKAIEIKPDYPDALNNIGLLHYGKKDFEQAEEFFERALETDPKHLNSIVNLGSVKTFQNDFKSSLSAFELATDIAKKNEDVKNLGLIKANIGFCYLRMGQLEDAVTEFNKALEYDSENILAHYNKAEALLKMGKFEEGWIEYEWRIKRSEFGKRKFHKPFTLNSELKDKKILVYGEQGLGDTLHFVRYLKQLKEYGTYLILECDKSLHDLLFRTGFIDELIEKNPVVEPDIEYDYSVPLLSLPLIFNTTLNNVPAEMPYLFADIEKTKFWNQFIAENKLNIGLVWGGSPTHQNDKNRSLKLRQLSNLFNIKNIGFFSLQKGIPQMQLNDYSLFVKDLDKIGIKSFDDTAAIIENLDLVITVDTSVAHLAAALGKETWVLIPFNADWRWMTERTDSPWYPTMRLFRQSSLSDWSSVIDDIENELKSRTENKSVIKSDKQNENLNFVDNEKLKNFFDEIRNDVYPELESELHTNITAEIFNSIFPKISLEQNAKVLDVGCGGGVALKLFKEKGLNAIGITLSEEDIAECNNFGLEARLMDQNFLDFENNEFDLVWARHVLEHSAIPLLAIKEINRVLKPNGFAYVEVPAPETSVAHEANPNHYSVFGSRMWESLFNKAGFKTIISQSVEIGLDGDAKDRYLVFLLQSSEPQNQVNIFPSGKNELYLALTSGENFGWGVCSNYLKKELKEKIKIFSVDDDHEKFSSENLNGKVLHALTNRDFESLHDVRGKQNYGYTFFEQELTQKSVSNARNYDLVLAGSTWCEEKMNEVGIMNTGTLLQGIDPAKFYYSPKEKKNDLFVIFSGGKFELRKGQDLVLKAFKILSEKYDDMILLNAWYNMWPQTMDMMSISKHIKYARNDESWKNFMVNLCAINGINGEKVFTLPLTPNDKLLEVYQSSDIGLFPNRCEGGTNLVLMEYMASGKPVVASLNTGHKDILTAENSLMLENMSDFTISDENGELFSHWYEPSLDEIISKIEWAYNNRSAINDIGKQAAEDMANKFTWNNTANALINMIF